MEVYEGMAAVLVEEQTPPDGRKSSEHFKYEGIARTGNQLHGVHDVLAAGWEGDENAKISSLDIWR
jgi:hypothetical protein